jgi:SAM-dependent methyltransferase
MANITLKRRIFRRTPILSGVVKKFEKLEEQNRELRNQLDYFTGLRMRSRAQPAPSEPHEEAAIPIPPDELRQWVAGTDDLKWFLESGQLAAQTIIDTLAKQHLTIDQFDSLLDFGCGCGRVIRHLHAYNTVQLHGSDCNPNAIRWCDENFEFAEFSSNTIEPPIRYRDQSFDLVYAFSVFTHLTEPLQAAWIQEMRRIIRPNGYLIISLHGNFYIPQIKEEVREAYCQGNLVVTGGELVGLNSCTAFHPETYVRNVMLGGMFRVCEFIPEGALGNPKQDIYLLQAR